MLFRGSLHGLYIISTIFFCFVYVSMYIAVRDQCTFRVQYPRGFSPLQPLRPSTPVHWDKKPLSSITISPRIIDHIERYSNGTWIEITRFSLHDESKKNKANERTRHRKNVRGTQTGCPKIVKEKNPLDPIINCPNSRLDEDKLQKSQNPHALLLSRLLQNSAKKKIFIMSRSLKNFGAPFSFCQKVSIVFWYFSFRIWGVNYFAQTAYIFGYFWDTECMELFTQIFRHPYVFRWMDICHVQIWDTSTNDPPTSRLNGVVLVQRIAMCYIYIYKHIGRISLQHPQGKSSRYTSRNLNDEPKLPLLLLAEMLLRSTFCDVYVHFKFICIQCAYTYGS